MSTPIASLGLHHILGVAALALAGGTAAYGTYVSLMLPGEEAAASQASADKIYELVYADAHKALFRTPDGFSLVVVGSVLATAGRIRSIEQHDQRWVVTTSKNLVFARN